MQTILYMLRHALPVLFMGYAVFVNIDVFTDEPLLDEVEGDVITGEAASEVAGLYSAALPHRETAVSFIGAGRYLLLGEGREGVTAGSNHWLFSDEEMRPAKPETVAGAVDQIATVADALAAQDTRLVVVPIPAKVDVYRDEAPAGAGEAMEAQYARFRDALADRDIASVDTRPALIEGRTEAPMYLTTDTHWTPRGAARVADRVAASGKVAQGETEFIRRARNPEEFVGDLVSFVTSDSLAPRLGLGPERVTPYVAEEAGGADGGIFASDADEAIDLVLIGTSYSANKSWSFAPALKLALGRDVLNLATEGRGPLAPMLDYLDEPARDAAGAETVIWEYPVRYLGQPEMTVEEELHG
jgi:alginate O-acetyltransferase complex protein AlgJ